MKWTEERDRFIAETLAFVQSVKGKTPKRESRIEVVAVGTRKHAPAPVEIPLSRTAQPAPSDVRTEIQNRISNFRAHQERFHRERDEYFMTTLAKARAAIESEAAAASKLQK
jgi:hypothetical protein